MGVRRNVKETRGIAPGQYANLLALIAFATLALALVWAPLGTSPSAFPGSEPVRFQGPTASIVTSLSSIALGSIALGSTAPAPSQDASSQDASSQGAPSQDAPIPEDMQGEGEKEVDDEREKDLALLSVLTPQPATPPGSTLTPAPLLRPRQAVPRGVEKPPRG